MARVSLILPLSTGASPAAERLERYRRHLEASGHEVELLGVADPRSVETSAVPTPGWPTLVAERRGLATAAFTGLARAEGEVLVILDPERGYRPEDVASVVEPLASGEAELVVAARTGDGGSARVARRLVGSTDPLSGLVGLTRTLAREAELTPVGSWFTLELLARAGGRRLDVRVGGAESRARRRLELDDLRHLKGLADHRYGNYSRLVQFCFVGASGMVIDLSCYALFQWLLGRTPLAAMTVPVIGGSLGLAVAGALAIALALTWNFSLNRRLTFNYARHGSLPRQFLAYALSNALGIGLSFSLRLVLPGQFRFFDRHKLAAAAVGIVAATGVSFSMARWFVFRRRPASEAAARRSVGGGPSESPTPGASRDVATPHRSTSTQGLCRSSCKPF